MTGAPDIIGVALRTGWFYGPATSRGPGGEHVEAIRRRRFPVLGSGGGMWPFVHVDDVAVATTLNAIERGQAGVYNVVDGDSAPVAQWLPDPRRDVAGADPPRHVPACIAPRAADAHGVAMMTATRRLERQAREAFGWSPAYPIWRGGVRAALAPAPRHHSNNSMEDRDDDVRRPGLTRPRGRA